MEVTKASGVKEEFSVEKIHKVVEWATDGINGVSASDIEMNANLSIYNGISTREIHDVLVRSASDLISQSEPNYQYVAARLLNMQLRKEVWGSGEHPILFSLLIERNVDNGIYDPQILDKWDEDQVEELQEYIKHGRDDNFTYAGLQQMIDKYLVKNRDTGEIYETPQFAYMLIAMCLFDNTKDVKAAYDCYSSFEINLPTPIMCGVRSVKRQFASCVLVDVEDDLDGIFASVHAVGKYTANRAGIGINAGRIRPINAPIRGGEVMSTGIIPYLKCFETAVKSTTQNGIRGGSATVHVPFWHYEIEDVMVLKNNAGTDENRVRKLDYSVQFCKLFYDRLIANEDITLFNPHEAVGLYEAFGNNKEFEKLYKKYESSRSLKFKKKVPARRLAEIYARERLETGRIYSMNVDSANEHGSWDVPVRMSNLCVAPETMILTKDGYVEISELEGETVDVWNGERWSETKVAKTGLNQKLVNVYLSNGLNLDCTPYHKWYVWDGQSSARGRVVEKRTHELREGDKLIKFNLPKPIESEQQMKYPYTHGLFCADGTHEGPRSRRISLYGEKCDLVDHLDFFKNRGADSSGRINLVMYEDMEDKFYVPINNCLSDKLKWLAGLLDGDGGVSHNANSYAVQLKSIHKQFLVDIVLMLQTIGVHSSIGRCCDAGGPKLMPDGSGGYKMYETKDAYRLNIAQSQFFKLLTMGLQTHRLHCPQGTPNRSALRFVKIEAIVDDGRFDDTFCVTDSHRGMATFGGILTGQCQEIIQPTKPIKSVEDKEGEIGICILSALNLLELGSDKDIENACNMAVRTLDSIIDYQDYPVVAGETFTKSRRSLGIGVTNFAGWLAKNKLKYEDPATLGFVHNMMEKIQYYLISASCDLAKELGACEKFEDTKYAKGLLPIDWYKKSVDELIAPNYNMDWETLRERVKTHGLRHSTLSAIMPCESSSVIQNSTNGIEKVRNYLSIKKAKNGLLKQLVPNYKTRKSFYSLAWESSDNRSIINIAAVIQKFVDMSMSTNLYYNYEHYPESKIPLSALISDQVYAYKYGLKNLYYANSPDGDGAFGGDADMEDGGGCSGGGCSI